jgi:dephospho-CoA kinase
MTCSKTVVALTGGIGSGKSQVARLFAEWGAVVVDADDLAREVVAPGSPGLAKTAEAFGAQILKADGSLDRAALGSMVFSDETRRKKLEEILHPLIRRLWLSRLKTLQETSSASLIIYTLPLFFESEAEYPEVQRIVHVAAPEQLRISRVTTRDGSTEENVKARIKAQLPDEEKNSRSDFVIVNDGTYEELRQRARAVFDALVHIHTQPH